MGRQAASGDAGRPAGQGRRAALAAASLALVAAACSSGGGDDSAGATDEPTTTPPTTEDAGPAPVVPCPNDRHAVVVDVRLLVRSENELYSWWADTTYQPVVRPGAVELLQAFFQRNYEVVYLTGWASDTLLDETVPVTQALPQWIAAQGFPNGDATSLHMWDPARTSDEAVHKTQVMIDLGSDDVTVERVYAGAAADVPTYRSGGVTEQERIWAFDLDADVAGAVRIPGNDLVAHREGTVDGEGDICTPAGESESTATTAPA